MRLSRIFKVRKWHEALLEVALIFIGINLSIWFNNWNEDQKKHKAEAQILKELHTAVLKDAEGAIHGIEIHKKREERYRLMIDYLEKKKPLDDTLSKAFKYALGLSFHHENKAAYEGYKIKGLELIRNDSVRLSIIDYYEEEVEWLMENQQWIEDYYNAYILPVYIEYSLRDIKPIDYKQMLGNKKMVNILEQGLDYNIMMRREYKRFAEQSALLEKMLSREMEKMSIN